MDEERKKLLIKAYEAYKEDLTEDDFVPAEKDPDLEFLERVFGDKDNEEDESI